MTTKATETKGIQVPTKTVLTPEERAKSLAVLSLAPAYTAAAVVEAFAGAYGQVDALAVADELSRQCKAVHGNDLRRLEAMLTAQAHSLDVMFTSLARRGKAQQHLAPYEAHMKLALRAQSQCRATVETLAAIKNPPVVFAKQANIAHGHQQVNNGTAAPVAHAEQTDKPQTELLEHDDGERLDTGTAAATSRGDQAMETVATVDRPAHEGRQGRREP